MKNNEKVSIVIPVFNGEKYIENCINSLIIQTYKDIEIIIVDDGSIDNTGNIVKKMVNLDNRIIYIYQKNSGVSSARNNGIKGSSGKYITFVDSDDSVQKNYVEYLHSLINIDNADIALTRYPKKFKSNTRIKNNKKMQDDNVEIVTGVSAANEMLCYKIVISPWNKMFKKEILIKNNILFNQNLSFGEGFEFVINSFLHSNKVVIGNKKIYNYRVDNMNSVMTKFSRKLVTGSIDSQKSILKLINNNTKYEDNIFLHKEITEIDRSVNNGELVPSARSNCTTLPKQEYRLAGWLYRSATALCQRCEPLFR